MDRREGKRLRTIYWPALVERAGKLSFVIMRNVSHEGASFVGASGLSCGDHITYKVANSEKIAAKVVWSEDDRIGVQNQSLVEDLSFSVDKPYRSVRLPIEVPVSFFRMGSQHKASLKNISQRGACLEHHLTLSPGEYLTLKVGGIAIEKATVVWASDGKMGLRFPQALNPQTFRKALELLQSDSQAHTLSEPIAA